MRVPIASVILMLAFQLAPARAEATPHRPAPDQALFRVGTRLGVAPANRAQTGGARNVPVRDVEPGTTKVPVHGVKGSTDVKAESTNVRGNKTADAAKAQPVKPLPTARETAAPAPANAAALMNKLAWLATPPKTTTPTPANAAAVEGNALLQRPLVKRPLAAEAEKNEAPPSGGARLLKIESEIAGRRHRIQQQQADVERQRQAFPTLEMEVAKAVWDIEPAERKFMATLGEFKTLEQEVNAGNVSAQWAYLAKKKEVALLLRRLVDAREKVDATRMKLSTARARLEATEERLAEAKRVQAKAESELAAAKTEEARVKTEEQRIKTEEQRVRAELALAAQTEAQRTEKTARGDQYLVSLLKGGESTVAYRRAAQRARAAAFTSAKPRDGGGGTTEDAVAMNPEKGLYAISDGVTNAVHSGVLSRLLVQRWASRPATNVGELGSSWLKEVQSEWAQHTSKLPGTNAWFNVGQRGDATFLGARIVEGQGGPKLNVMGIGDSIIFVLRKGRLAKSFPFEHSGQFTNVVRTLPSKGSPQSPLQEVTWDLLPEDEVFMTTDALGKWTFTELEAGRDPFPRLREVKSHAAWTKFVTAAQAGTEGHTMDVDDTALVRFVIPKS